MRADKYNAVGRIPSLKITHRLWRYSQKKLHLEMKAFAADPSREYSEIANKIYTCNLKF